MPDIEIKFTNAAQIVASLNAKVKNIESTLEKTARQMGVLATNEIHPLTHKKSNTWDNSIHAVVTKLGPFKYELWVGSKGAFAKGGYNYGARQERLFHPIEKGWWAAQGPMKDLYQKNITAGLMGKSITQNIAPGSVDEIGMMAGF
jgi:hypothetical protein